MNYITKKLDRKICLYMDREDYGNLKIYLQVKFEFELILIMSYLWNKNISKVSDEKQQMLYKMIQNPSIGEIVNINRELDIDNELMKSKKIRETINRYPAFRNEKIGHGYSFEDDSEKFIHALEIMTEDLDKNIHLFYNDYSIVNIEKNVDGVLEGILYRSDGEYINWEQREVDCHLEKALYFTNERDCYYKISPFVYMDDDKIYTFRCIDEIMLGRFKYNRLFETETITREWNEYKNIQLSEDEYKRVTINGTIINKFENNYDAFQYIETKSIQKKISDFIRNQSCVYATLWGHGGVGKTASVQNFCEKLGTDEERRFDYILFVSAKDRLYDSYTGTIKSVNNNTTYITIIKNLNKLINNDEAFAPEKVLEAEVKFLLIIDDFETFSSEDKKQIEKFVRQLDITRHKVLITTRANSILGEEIKTNELDCEETYRFLVEIYKILFNKDLSRRITQSIKDKIYNVTSGRPLFILQFAYICSRSGLKTAINQDIKNSQEAIEFLYGRIYEYLNSDAQKIFGVLGILADSDDMTNLLDKVKYILNMENDQKFGENIDEIEKLRLIEIIDNKFYKVYSTEILNIMKSYFEKMDDVYKRNIRNRINQVSKDKNLDNDHALLENANASKFSKSEQEVVSLFLAIINRKNTKKEVRIQALLNMSEYLFNDRGNKQQAIQKLEKFYYEFKDDSSYIKMYATYLRGNQESEKAIDILLEFLSVNRNMKNNDILVLFGLLVTYRSLYWLDLREETKMGHRYGEIYDEDYKMQMMEQSKEFKDIKRKHGKKLIDNIRNLDFQRISSEARQNLITAAYQYVEVCIRLKDWQSGKFLCNYVSKNLAKYNYGLNFEQKERRILEYEKMEKAQRRRRFQ